jgi:hypothetical protein
MKHAENRRKSYEWVVSTSRYRQKHRKQNHPHSFGQTHEYRPAPDTSTTGEVSDPGTLSILV